MIAALLLVLSAPSRAQTAVGDAVRGKQVFQLCAACHDIAPVPDTMPQGPPLAGIVGRGIGTVSGFDYSASLMELARQERLWSLALLDRYLAAPWRLAPRTTMSFPGLSNDQERADVIAFLETL
jgi:cytochrome c